ncbi:unnamed protein product [Durusdinium trenchii]|uniref:Uncharacterized protein n=1 Tax=Durusdinium trenchii TaxID=1381693 RepID=A0ABP0ID28_9DINO
MASSSQAKKEGPRALVNDITVRTCVREAMGDGLPAATLKKWVTDLSKNFYVQDDASFINAWAELREKWEKRNMRKQWQKKQRERLSEEPHSKRRSRESDVDPEEVLSCLDAAREDLAQGRSDSFERATALHLTLALSADRALFVWSALSSGDGRGLREDEAPSTVTALRSILAAGARGTKVSLKQLALLVHPDKTPHPRAKEAFQRLAPELRAGEGLS